MNCKAIDGLIRYLTRVIPDGLLLSIAHVRFTWFNKCKRFAGLNFKCKLEVELIIKNYQLFYDEAISAESLTRQTNLSTQTIETEEKMQFSLCGELHHG